jgi:hypothetical protein
VYEEAYECFSSPFASVVTDVHTHSTAVNGAPVASA